MSETARTQKERPLAIETPLGEDALMLQSMHGIESLGRMFSFELDLIAEGTPVDYKDILGKNVAIRLDLLGGKTRFFNGYISRFSFIALDENNKDHTRLYHYRATMVPWTWFLTRVADCRIFQNMTVIDILKQLFGYRGFSDFRDATTGSYHPRTYCVQYRETDFNFISRLMEDEGIYYYFEHEDNKHTLVLCDAPTVHKHAPDYDDLHFDEPDPKADHDAFVWNWTCAQEVTSNKYALADYDHLQPKTNLAAEVNVQHDHDPGEYEIFDYPGGYADPAEGRRYAGVRMHEIEAQYIVAEGTTSARGVFAGATFNLQDHPAYDPDEYLITSVAYQLQNDDLGTGSGRANTGPVFRAQLTCIPTKNNNEFRPPRLTPKPLVQGPQTAVVVGPSGEEIHTNEHGQVKVKFFWDRDPKKDESSSCWVRVSQPSAGLGWGSVSIPRIGQEVIVDFLEGDPDRPIITGRVYNGVNVPPNALPGGMNLTGFKSNSTKGGGGFNEITIDDTKGKEQIFIHGQYDMHVRVKNDQFQTISNDQHTVVSNNAFLNVAANTHNTVGGNTYVDIGGELHENVGGFATRKVGGAMSLQVGGDVAEKFSGSHSETTATKISLKAASIVLEADKITLKTGGVSIALDAATMNVKVGGALKVESANTAMNSKTSTKIEAGTTFKASSLSSTMEGSVKATVKGLLVKVSADANGSFEAGANMKVKGSKVDVSGDALVNVAAGLIKLN
jgi:type VI secretion system secreted protein VgrG